MGKDAHTKLHSCEQQTLALACKVSLVWMELLAQALYTRANGTSRMNTSALCSSTFDSHMKLHLQLSLTHTNHAGPGHQSGKIGDHCVRVCLSFPSITGVSNSEQDCWIVIYICNKNAELFMFCLSYHHSGGPNLGIYLYSVIISPWFLCQYCSRHIYSSFIFQIASVKERHPHLKDKQL